MRFYLDEDVPVEVAGTLTAHGHDVALTVSEGRSEASDADQLLYSTGHGRVLITHNKKHFIPMHEYWTVWGRALGFGPHGGILAMDQNRYDRLAQAILALCVSEPVLQGVGFCFRWSHFNNGWQRVLP